MGYFFGYLLRSVSVNLPLTGKHKPWVAAASGHVPANGPLEILMTARCEHFDIEVFEYDDFIEPEEEGVYCGNDC